jgi:hypothetical protein
MRKCLFALAMCLMVVIGSPARAEEASEALGFIISYDLRGADARRGTAVVREGAELAPKLWMPLFAGDTVFVRDPESSILLDIADGTRVEVKGIERRFTLSATVTSAGMWQFVTQIAELFGDSEEEDAPTNMMSKGDRSLDVPMAARGPNYIVSVAEPLWVGWRGGKGPYRLSVEVEGVRQPLGEYAETEAAIAVPKNAGSRFALIIEDSRGGRVRIAFHLRKQVPGLPEEIAREAPRLGAGQAIVAAWLAAQENGAWRFEAARVLRAVSRDDKTAARLLVALTEGWRPHQ